jgi:hypothetical protein
MAILLAIVYLVLGGVLGQVAAGLLGCSVATLVALFKWRLKALLGFAVAAAIAWFVVVPLLLLAAGSLGDGTSYKSQGFFLAGGVLGFLGGFMWIIAPAAMLIAEDKEKEE